MRWRGRIDIRDKAHVEAPGGWVVTSAMAGGRIVVADIPLSLHSLARYAARLPIRSAAKDLVDDVGIVEAIGGSAARDGAVVKL